jgi:hypothetical protein
MLTSVHSCWDTNPHRVCTRVRIDVCSIRSRILVSASTDRASAYRGNARMYASWYWIYGRLILNFLLRWNLVCRCHCKRCFQTVLLDRLPVCFLCGLLGKRRFAVQTAHSPGDKKGHAHVTQPRFCKRVFAAWVKKCNLAEEAGDRTHANPRRQNRLAVGSASPPRLSA